MKEVINYFESLEARLTAAEARNSALENRVVALENEREALKARVEELNKHLQEIQPKLIAMAGHLNRMNEILEDVQVQGLTLDEPEPVVEPEIPEIQNSSDPEIQNPSDPEIENSSDPEIQNSEEPAPTPEPKEIASPKAAIYGKAVDDIRLAISLGDRFLYQRELFGQNAERMQRTLDELNKLGSFDEAIAYISSRFQWDTESTTYQQFLVTLHRRFG